jgi:ATP-dependent Clp protease ATP-binding subunit ClpC
MFERFTDRSRQVIVVAQDEARELGHPLIRPEHLALGLVQGVGVAARALSDFGVTYAEVRERVLAVTPAGEALAGERLPFTPQAKKVLERSLREALRLKHRYIGTEHLLLGLLRTDEQLAARLFAVNLGLLRARVTQYATGSPDDRVRRSPALHAALGRASGAAGDDPVTTGQVLVALAGDPESQAGKALATIGMSERALADAVRATPLDNTTDAPGPPRWFEIRFGGHTTTVQDAELTKLLSEVTPEQLRALLRKSLGAANEDTEDTEKTEGTG